MSDEPIEKPIIGVAHMIELPPLLDPFNVQVQIIDGLVTAGMIGNTINMTLATNRMGRDESGAAKNEYVIAARLRFDPNVARLIRDAIDSQLVILSAPTGKAN